MQVDLEKLFNAFVYLKQINSQNIHDIEWMLNGEVQKIDKSLLDQWKFTGLNNTDFSKYAFDKNSEVGKLFEKLLPRERDRS